MLFAMLVHVLSFGGYSEPETMAGANLRGNRHGLRWQTEETDEPRERVHLSIPNNAPFSLILKKKS